MQRTRFGLWGESVGLIPNPADGSRLRYDKNLDRPDIRPGLERVLWNIKLLLEEARCTDERYGIKVDTLQGSEISTSVGLNIFKASFDRFKSRIRKHQKETSTWNVTRWAIHDAAKFERMINRLEGFVDGLENVTKALGLLHEQRARLQEEIESISDVESLRILRDASSSHHSSNRASQRNVSDTASRCLDIVAESIAEKQTVASISITSDSTPSFITAKTRPSKGTQSLLSEELPLPGAWPKSTKSYDNSKILREFKPKRQPRIGLKPSLSCEPCLSEHYKCENKPEEESCSRCIQTGRICSFRHKLAEGITETFDAGTVNPSIPKFKLDSGDLEEGLPQNQRLMHPLIERAKPRQPLSFAAGDAHYGEKLATIKSQDENYWLSNSGKILGYANSSVSAAKRMFIELRNIRTSKVPFVSAVPLDNCLNKVLASIEGPPETPYEGGIFWIAVKLPENNPYAPPLMRFHTKVYHPNISPQGHICSDYQQNWMAYSEYTHDSHVKDPTAIWYRSKSSNAEWTLGALLTALCGLLATPDVDDPLVPEIAQKYLEDYEGYCENAKRYTQLFATGERPNENQLLFLEETPDPSTISPASIFQPSSELELDLISLQAFLREKYDEKAEFGANEPGGESFSLRQTNDERNRDTLSSLLSNQENYTADLSPGSMALLFAVRMEDIRAVKALLDKGADIEAKDHNIQTPLISAAARGSYNMVKLLLENGADIEAIDGMGGTALNIASLNGRTETVDLLLENGADIETEDHSKWTPLITAARRGHFGVVELLVEKGADITTAADNIGLPRIMVTSTHGSKMETLRLLRWWMTNHSRRITTGQTRKWRI